MIELSLQKVIQKFRGRGKKRPPRAPKIEMFWSALGSFLGIAAIYAVGDFQDLPIQENLFLVGSFGATAVLIYGIPLSPFAQPRNVVGGHLVSALVGVSCHVLLAEHMMLAAASAVSLSIVFMHLSSTLHPPGGATALIAVIGGEGIYKLGYSYVIAPIGAGAVIMLIVALIVNNHSKSRHYPEYWL
ncbi:MAG: HPP family protein [Gammaproteobacteria bacterium]|nr:HPP family protein [Gammaproteobacteria bacterium]